MKEKINNRYLTIKKTSRNSQRKNPKRELKVYSSLPCLSPTTNMTSGYSQRKNPKRELKGIISDNFIVNFYRSSLSKKESQKGIESHNTSPKTLFLLITCLSKKESQKGIERQALRRPSSHGSRNKLLLSKKESQKGIERTLLVIMVFSLWMLKYSQRKNPKRELKENGKDSE